MKGDTTLQFEHNTSFTNIGFLTSYNEILELTDFKAFPNPFVNEINLLFEMKEKTELEINLFNNVGQNVGMLWKGAIAAGKSQLALDGLERANMNALKAKALEQKVYVSFRSIAVRVSPYLYNEAKDLEKLLRVFKAVL